MHFDLAHAAVSAILIGFIVLFFRQKDPEDAPKRQWDWRIFFAVFVVMFVLNLVWPYRS
ncbi:MAG: hypothetical protein HKO08_11790 [Erythrobacter sp.]|nr:hypothetical protein [Erythrobacter sp.]